MKIKYTGGLGAGWYLTINKEYYCESIVINIENNKIRIVYTVFDDEGFLAPIGDEFCHLTNSTVTNNWILKRELFPQKGLLQNFFIEFVDQRVYNIGDYDILIDLPAHIADQEETGDDFFDTDRMKKELDELHEIIKKEHGE